MQILKIFSPPPVLTYFPKLQPEAQDGRPLICGGEEVVVFLYHFAVDAILSHTQRCYGKRHQLKRVSRLLKLILFAIVAIPIAATNKKNV